MVDEDPELIKTTRAIKQTSDSYDMLQMRDCGHLNLDISILHQGDIAKNYIAIRMKSR